MMHSMGPQPQPAIGFEFAWLAVLPAVALVAAGLWMLRGRRGAMNREEEHAREVRVAMRGDALPTATRWSQAAAWRDSRTEPTRVTFGLSAMFLGYHLAAWVLPEAWLPLRVPVERWWLLVGGVFVVVVSSMLIDRMQAMEKKVSEKQA